MTQPHSTRHLTIAYVVLHFPPPIAWNPYEMVCDYDTDRPVWWTPAQSSKDRWADPVIKQRWLFHHADYFALPYTPYTDVPHSEWVNGELWDDNTGGVEYR